MFANTNLCVINFGFPDVCLVPTPAGPVPTPFPNFAISITHIPSQFCVIICGGLAENLVTMGTISNGDNAGIALGVATHDVMGPDQYVFGSVKVSFGGVLATRLTSITMANMMNIVGLTITPCQPVVILLS